MKLWIIGLILVLGLVLPSTNGESSDEDDEYEIKRFLIESRALDGKPHCVETRRKRSTPEADYIENIDTQSASIEEGDISESAEQDTNVEDDATDSDDLDLTGSSGILIVQSPSSPNVPLFFAVRPVLGNSSNKKYLQMQIFDDSSINDEKYFDKTDDDDDFDDYMEDYEEIHSPKRQNLVANKKSKRKQLPQSQIENSELGLMEYRVKPKKKSSKRKSNQNQSRIELLKKKLEQNRKSYRNAVQNRRDIKKNNKNNSDSTPVNCIVIHKMPFMDPEPETTEKSSSNLLGISSAERLPNRRYGLRKRYKPKRFE